ncbi:unannotated protein [freshwater metagenome]|uniref:Unannotated protein n=1 Tax=freshwater metagenome TaxID=449393 RepID=A0A6J6IPN1_9ZZZZ|nr:DUF1775 domain-containing protein [Actinomycetota bacterium]MSZ41826.1 DUF1775 domain-containing protein [Actinomycetota bacterium]
MRNNVQKTAVHSIAVAGALIVGAVVLANPASAHMGVDVHGATMTAGKGATIFLRPGHGCDGDATNTITVEIPSGVTGVKPQQKAGWDTAFDGKTITWSGGALPDSQFDDFGIKLTWPKLDAAVKSQAIYFKTVQICNPEIKVATQGKTATVTGELPSYAGKKVSLFVNDIPLTKNDVTVGQDGSFTIKTTTAKIPTGSDVQAKIKGVLVGNSVAGQDAWIDIPVPGSTASLASPAPSVTITA